MVPLMDQLLRSGSAGVEVGCGASTWARGAGWGLGEGLVGFVAVACFVAEACFAGACCFAGAGASSGGGAAIRFSVGVTPTSTARLSASTFASTATIGFAELA